MLCYVCFLFRGEYEHGTEPGSHVRFCYCLGYFACKLKCQMSSSFAGSLISCCLIQNFTSNPACMRREPIYISSAICSEILSPFQDGRNRQMEHGQLSEASQVTLIIHLSYTLQQVQSCRWAYLRLLLSVLVNYYFFSQFSILISLKKNSQILLYLSPVEWWLQTAQRWTIWIILPVNSSVTTLKSLNHLGSCGF